MSENAFIINKETKTFDKAKGLEEYNFSKKFATEILQKTDPNIFNSLVNAVIEESGTDEEETTIQQQRWATTFEISQRPETVTFASLGFPSIINHKYSPSVIQWCDRMISLQSYDESSITLYPSMSGTNNPPFKVGIEIIGEANSIPAYICKPFVYPDLRADRGIFVLDYDEESFTLEAYHAEIDKFPLSVGVYVRGKENELDAERQEWYMEVTMAQRVQSFNFVDANAGKVDDYVYDVPIILESPNQTFNWNSLKDIKNTTLPGYLENPRIAKFGFRAECGAYIYECTNNYVTVKRMHWWADDLPVKFNMQVRGGANA